jgi:hypothetical protein
MADYLVPRSFLTIEFGRQTRLAEAGYDRGRGFDYHYSREAAKLDEIAEALILCPIVTVATQGPNIPLAFLAKYFGIKPLFQLLDERAIEFKQITGSIALATEPDNAAYLSPEPADRSAANSDPEAAANVALERYGVWIPEADRRVLVAKAAAHTIQTRERVPEEAIEIALNAVPNARTALSTRAIGSDAERIELIRRQLYQWAHSYCQSAMLYDDSYALLNETDTWTFAYDAALACTAKTGIVEAAQSVLDKENVLSFAELLRQKKLLPQDIALLRGLPATDAFRTWLWGTVTDGKDPAAEWLKLRSINLEEGWLRQVSIVTLAIVKAVASGFVTSKWGVEGEVSRILTEATTDVVVDNAFASVIGKLRQHNPRNFVDSLVTAAGRRSVSRRQT